MRHFICRHNSKEHELVGDGIAGDGYTANGGVGGDRTDGDTMTAGAGVALEDDVAAFVDGEAVILVMNCTSLKHQHNAYRSKMGGHVTYPR